MEGRASGMQNIECWLAYAGGDPNYPMSTMNSSSSSSSSISAAAAVVAEAGLFAIQQQP